MGSYNTVDARPSDNKHLGDARDSAYNPAASSPQNRVSAAASNVASTVANAAPSVEDLKAQLSEASAQITKLKQQGEEQVARFRKTAADSTERLTAGTTGVGVQQHSAEGVPVPIVAALCLLSFLLAYFFF